MTIDIFQLYQREQKITHETPDGTKFTAVIKKPNKGEKERIYKAISKSRDEAEAELTSSPQPLKSLEDVLATFSLEEKVEMVLNNEEIMQMQSSDLFPIGDRSSMTAEELITAEKDFIKQWREKRKAQLITQGEKEIIELSRKVLIESRSMLVANETYYKYMCFYCVVNENGKPLFKNIEDIGKLDDIVYEWLKTEIDKFIKVLAQKEVRKVVAGNDFLAPTESVESTTGSVATTK